MEIALKGLQAISFADAISKINYVDNYQPYGVYGDMVYYGRLLLHQVPAPISL